MQKYKALITSLFALTTATLLADTNPKTTPPKEEEATTQPKGVITPSVAPRVADGVGVILTADFIWWKTHINGMEYAITGINDAGSNVPNYTSTSKGSIKQPDFDFTPGFKVGLGLDFAHDGWDLFGEYTWLQGGNRRNSFHAKEGLGAATSFNIIDPFGAIFVMSSEKGSSKWKQSFNVLDLMLGRNFFISRYLTLKPSIGLKTAWIQEKLKLSFLPTPFAFSVDGITSAKQLRRQNMWGLGMRFGLDGVWHFTKNWGIYGNIDATALWSDFHIRAKTKTIVVVPPGISSVKTTNLNTKESIQKVMAVLETGLGLTYMTWFHNEKYQFQAQAGWEGQVWVNFNHFVENHKSGDLSLQGLTLRAGFAF